jgi:hypothetical protein
MSLPSLFLEYWAAAAAINFSLRRGYVPTHLGRAVPSNDERGYLKPVKMLWFGLQLDVDIFSRQKVKFQQGQSILSIENPRSFAISKVDSFGNLNHQHISNWAFFSCFGPLGMVDFISASYCCSSQVLSTSSN